MNDNVEDYQNSKSSCSTDQLSEEQSSSDPSRPSTLPSRPILGRTYTALHDLHELASEAEDLLQELLLGPARYYSQGLAKPLHEIAEKLKTLKDTLHYSLVPTENPLSPELEQLILSIHLGRSTILDVINHRLPQDEKECDQCP